MRRGCTNLLFSMTLHDEITTSLSLLVMTPLLEVIVKTELFP
jgi:hypothetical protein